MKRIDSRMYKLLFFVVMSLSTACSYMTDKNSDGKSGTSSADKLPDGKEVPSGLPVRPRFSISAIPHIGASKAERAAIQARAEDANTFHFSLSSALNTARSGKNIVMSSYSIQTAFALLNPATATDSISSKEITKTLHFSGDSETFNSAMLGQMQAVESAFTSSNPSEKLEYLLVNQVWADDQYGLQSDFSDTIKKYYNAGVGSLPFSSNPDAARSAINGFVEHNTRGLVKDLLPEGSITNQTHTVLTNSVYMKADWALPFKKEETKAANFENIDGSLARPLAMSQAGQFSYGEGQDYTALSLDYVGGKVSMLFVLPSSRSDFVTFAEGFDGKKFSSILATLVQNEVFVQLPKMNFEWETELRSKLESLGLKQVFNAHIDNFPNLLSKVGLPVKLPLSIGGIFHKAKIIVDEKGTEAAAATAVTVGAVSLPPVPPKDFIVNRPVLFFIYEKNYGSIIFSGQLVKL